MTKLANGCDHCGEDLTSEGVCEWCQEHRRCELSYPDGCDGSDHDTATWCELPTADEPYRCQACSLCKSQWVKRYEYLAATEQI